MHSHLIKYWYYGYDEKRNASQEAYELNYISEPFIRKINEPIEDKPVLIPLVKKNK